MKVNFLIIILLLPIKVFAYSANTWNEEENIFFATECQLFHSKKYCTCFKSYIGEEGTNPEEVLEVLYSKDSLWEEANNECKLNDY